MSSLDVPGLDVSTRVRARDIQLAGVADLRRRVLMISGAVDTTDHDVSVCINLPEAGRWQVIKSETNLTDQTWVAMQVTTDEDSHFVNDEETLVLSRQFAKSFMTPDLRRLTFYDGEVRPGEAVLKVFTLDCGRPRRAVLRPDRPAGPAGAALAVRAPPRRRGLPRLRTARLRPPALGATVHCGASGGTHGAGGTPVGGTGRRLRGVLPARRRAAPRVPAHLARHRRTGPPARARRDRARRRGHGVRAVRRAVH